MILKNNSFYWISPFKKKTRGLEELFSDFLLVRKPRFLDDSFASWVVCNHSIRSSRGTLRSAPESVGGVARWAAERHRVGREGAAVWVAGHRVVARAPQCSNWVDTRAPLGCPRVPERAPQGCPRVPERAPHCAIGCPKGRPNAAQCNGAQCWLKGVLRRLCV